MRTEAAGFTETLVNLYWTWQC